MNENIVFFAIFAPVILIPLFAFLSLSDRFRIFISRYLLRKTIIVCRRDRDKEVWHSILETNPFGDTIAYRFPVTKIGSIRINEDGTGEYCGSIIWKRV